VANLNKKRTMKHPVMTVLASLALSSTLLAGAAQAAQQAASTYGTSAPNEVADRTVVIDPAAKWANVTDGETVTFAIGEQRFTFHFRAGRGVQSVRLRDIAPAGAEVPDIQIYLAHRSTDA
jgi:plastocyanin